jgi:hypothetical protein
MLFRSSDLDERILGRPKNRWVYNVETNIKETWSEGVTSVLTQLKPESPRIAY